MAVARGRAPPALTTTSLRTPPDSVLALLMCGLPVLAAILLLSRMSELALAMRLLLRPTCKFSVEGRNCIFIFFC